MKSFLNIPRLQYTLTNKDLSAITMCYDKYFGHHFVLYEGRVQHLMTKELAQCYRKHYALIRDKIHNIPLRLHNFIK